MDEVCARQHLLKIYHAGLASVEGRRCTRQALLNLAEAGPTHVVAIGKAAGAMFLGAQDVLQARLAGGLVIVKPGHAQGVVAGRGVTVIEAGHPWPNRASLEAGDALLDFIAGVPRHGRMVFLISGGASALVEVLVPGVGLGDWVRLNRWLLASGLDIGTMNRLRKAVSRIKGGRLAGFVRDRPTAVLLISDVPDDEPATIGSGLLAPPVRETAELPPLPPWVETILARGEPPPVADKALFGNIALDIIANLAQAKHAAAAQGRALGYDVVDHSETLTGDAVAAGYRLAKALLDGPPGLHVWGGETTVTLPPNPGRGGRNQSLALAAATVLAGVSDVALLAAGTDGTDGPTEDAGALVDGATLARGSALGMSAEKSLARADAGRYLHATGDLVQTGPTGTNVMDLVLGLKWRSSEATA